MIFRRRFDAPAVFLALLPAFLLVAACGEDRRVAPNVALSIDREEIRYAQFETYLRDNAGGVDLPTETEVLSQLFDQFVDEELLIRLAIERGLVLRAAGKDLPARIDQRLAMAYLLRNDAPPEPDEAALRAFYLAHLDELRRPESVQLRQILVDDLAQAEQARQALVAGEPFADVAARFSQVPVAELGDERGRLAREDLPPAFADSIFALAPGEVSDVFEADYGYHVFQVVAHDPAEVAPLDEVAPRIRRELATEIVDERVASFVAEARGRYNVEIYRQNLPFDYRGSYADEAEH